MFVPVHNAYDMAGNNISVTDFNGNTTNYVYDILGRQIKTVAPFSETATSTTKTYYDVNGNVIKTAVQNNAEGEAESYRMVDFAYDNMNRLIYTIEHPDSTTNEYTQYFYDSNGNVRNIVKGLTTPISSFEARPSTSRYLTYSYDVLNRNTVIRGTLSASDKYYTYDRSGNVVASRKGSNTVNYTYDPFGNVLTIQGGTDTSKHISYAYNALGLRTQMTDETGLTNYTYNDFGELISETKGGIIKTSGYNNMGMRTSFGVTSDGSSILSNTYAYDSLGRMTSVTQSGDTVSYVYDNNSNLIQQNTDGYVTAYAYNKANLRVSDEWGNNNYPTRQYSYYLDGNMKSSDTGFDIAYTYDNKNRLISSQFVYSDMEEVHETYEYDIFDNITKKTEQKYSIYTGDDSYKTFITEYEDYSGRNMLTKFEYEMIGNVKTLQSYTDYYYDDNGDIEIIDYYNSISKTGWQKDFEFDYLGRLMNVYEGNTLAYSYSYDGDNLRHSKTVNGDTTTFILDGMNVVAELGSQNNMAYLRGNGLEGYLKNNTVRKYYYNEPNGSTYIIYGDESIQNELVGEYAYGGFGTLIWDNWEETSFAYAGEYHDDETGFIYLRNRYYDPSIGRFISEDPAMDGLNWYVYCGNNPVNYVDPLGLEYLVISGSEYNSDDRYKYNFIEPAIKKIRELSELNDDENITWVISSTGYSKDALRSFNELATYLNVNIVYISDSSELQNYINSKNTETWMLSEERTSDPIKKVAVFSHGLTGRVELGYNQHNRESLVLDSNWIAGIFSEAFDNPNSAFYSCNTGTGGNDSFAQHWVNVSGGRTWAVVNGQTSYASMNRGESMNDKLIRLLVGYNTAGSRNYPNASSTSDGFKNFYR